VERHDGLLAKPKFRPPAFDLNLRTQQSVPALVDGALDHAHDPPQRVLVAVVGAHLPHIEQGYAFVRVRLAPVALHLGIAERLLGALLARVPLDHIVDWGGRLVCFLVGRDHSVLSIVSFSSSRRTSTGAAGWHRGEAARPPRHPLPGWYVHSAPGQ
jgi:hypothetical protein